MMKPATRQPSSLWHNNSVVVQLLGLSPVLALSTTVAYGLGLAIATMLVTVASCVTASLLQKRIKPNWRLVLFMLIIAFYTSIVAAIVQREFFLLYQILGIYLPLICCNVAILQRMECFASKHTVWRASLDAFVTALGFLLVIVALGALREWLSYGSLFAKLHLLVPDADSGITSSGAMVVESGSIRFSFTLLAPGALICLGLLVALKNTFDRRFPGKDSATAATANPVKRVRVTRKP